MADNISMGATAGVVLTDDCTTGHAQIVKLAISTDGSATLIPADATNGIDVDVTRVGGTVQVQSNSANIATETTAGNIQTAVQLIDNTIIADDATFTVGSTSVNVAGFLADDATPDSADEGDAVAARTTLDRKQIVVVGESGANLVRGGGSKTDTTDVSLMAPAGAGVYNYLTWVALYNSSTTVNTYVNVKDGSTVVAVIPLPALGGAVMNLTTPIRSTANTGINLATGASTTTAYLYGGGYKGA